MNRIPARNPAAEQIKIELRGKAGQDGHGPSFCGIDVTAVVGVEKGEDVKPVEVIVAVVEMVGEDRFNDRVVVGRAL